MASRTRQVGVARSRLLGKSERNRYRYAVAAASGIWRPERAVRLIRRSPEKPRNEPSSPICIAYLAFPRRVFLPFGRFAIRSGGIVGDYRPPGSTRLDLTPLGTSRPASRSIFLLLRA
jgi:hypothetical protein